MMQLEHVPEPNLQSELKEVKCFAAVPQSEDANHVKTESC